MNSTRSTKIRVLAMLGAIGLLAGGGLIWRGEGLIGTAGPVLIILGIVSGMLAVGVYLGDPDRPTAG